MWKVCILSAVCLLWKFSFLSKGPLAHSEHWGLNCPTSPPTPHTHSPSPTSRKSLLLFSFFAKPPLKSANFQSPPFLTDSLPPPAIEKIFHTLLLPLSSIPHIKNRIFHWTLIILKFFIINPIPHLLKLTKFLVEISQFNFLFKTDKNIKYFRF